jgi:2-iminobutanoate/2-iminopropanoate deaminase
MNREIRPSTVAAPAANYALAVASYAASVVVHTSGIVGSRPDGSVPNDLALQADVIWTTIGELLHGAQLGMTDVCSVTTYVVDGQDLSVVMAARDRALGGHRAASTLIVVPRLARPEWLMEIAVVASR